MKARPRRGLPRSVQAGLCLLLAVILTMGVSGCKGGIEQAGSDMYSQINKYTEESAQLMLEYMEEKYGEEFTLVPSVVTFYPGTPHGQYVRPVSHPEWRVNVNYSPNAEQPFSDNYVAFLKMDEVQAYLKPYFDEVYGPECRLFVRNPSDVALPASFSRETDIETYLSVARIGMSLYVNKDFSTSDANARQMWETPDFYTYSLMIKIFYFSQEDFESEAAQQLGNSTTLPCLYYGSLLILRSERETGYTAVVWKEGPALIKQ